MPRTIEQRLEALETSERRRTITDRIMLWLATPLILAFAIYTYIVISQTPI